MKKAVIIVALPILQALQLNEVRLVKFGVVELFANIGNSGTSFNRVDDV